MPRFEIFWNRKNDSDCLWGLHRICIFVSFVWNFPNWKAVHFQMTAKHDALNTTKSLFERSSDFRFWIRKSINILIIQNYQFIQITRNSRRREKHNSIVKIWISYKIRNFPLLVEWGHLSKNWTHFFPKVGIGKKSIAPFYTFIYF